MILRTGIKHKWDNVKNLKCRLDPQSIIRAWPALFTFHFSYIRACKLLEVELTSIGQGVPLKSS